MSRLRTPAALPPGAKTKPLGLPRPSRRSGFDPRHPLTLTGKNPAGVGQSAANVQRGEGLLTKLSPQSGTESIAADLFGANRDVVKPDAADISDRAELPPTEADIGGRLVIEKIRSRAILPIRGAGGIERFCAVDPGAHAVEAGGFLDRPLHAGPSIGEYRRRRLSLGEGVAICWHKAP